MADAYRKQTALKLRIMENWTPTKTTELALYRLRDKPGHGQWYLQVAESPGYGDTGTGSGAAGKPVPVSDSIIENIDTLLRRVAITLEPNTIVGEDGTDYYLELPGPGVRAKFSWWVHPPDEWQPLEDIVELLIEQAGPGCSDFTRT